MDTDHISICLSEADGGTSEPQRDSVTDAPSVIRKETRAVFWVKVAILLILIVAGLFVSIGTYLYISRKDSSNSNQSSVVEFQDFADNFLFNFEQGMTSLAGSVYTLSITYTTYVADSASITWPDVTLPHFTAHTLVPQQLAGNIIFAPLVTKESRQGFELYARKQQSVCAEESCALGSTERIYSLNNDGSKNFEENGELFSPIWQGDTNLQLFDQLSNPVMGRAINAMLATKTVILSEILSNWSAPQSVLFYPIFSSLKLSNQSIVGSISAVFTWSKFLANLLPTSSKAAVLVLENSCETLATTQFMTFQIADSVVSFVGFGDLRNPQVKLPDIARTIPGSYSLFNNGTSGEDGVNNTCTYSLHVSPLALEPTSTSKRSVWFTVFLACVFFVAMVRVRGIERSCYSLTPGISLIDFLPTWIEGDLFSL